MAQIQVFDPAMCCSTGVCGPAVDPALVRFAADLEWLKASGVEVQRFNLSQEPGAFVANPTVAEALRTGSAALPLVLVGGKIVAQGAYPEREALAALAGLTAPKRLHAETEAAKPCCGPARGGAVAPSKPAATSKKCCC